MYLIPSNVTLFVDGDRISVTTDWMRSLVLLRDSLGGRYGPLKLMAPSLPASLAAQSLEVVDERECGILAVPGFDDRCRARKYWLEERGPWLDLVRREVAAARVVHSGLDDVYRPVAFDACLAALNVRKPLVFVRDIDAAQQLREMARDHGPVERAKARLYGMAFDGCMRYGVRRAALSLMKGRLLCDKYKQAARNMYEFEDTSYTTAEIVPSHIVEQRLATLVEDRPMRLVYCGRIEWRKGVEQSIRLIGAARRQGVRVCYDVIGDGSHRAVCERIVAELGLADCVRFLGKKPYGPDLLRELAAYDALLFTPPAEDTPRMIFDAYAAGLPMIAYGIEYAKERAEKENASIIMPPNDPETGGRVLATLARDRYRLADLARKAMAAAAFHAADVWYRRRAEWTFDAVDRYERDQRAS